MLKKISFDLSILKNIIFHELHENRYSAICTYLYIIETPQVIDGSNKYMKENSLFKYIFCIALIQKDVI